MTSNRTLQRRLLAAAQALLDQRPHSAAARRRAVSSAYYAVFHSLAKLCTDVLLPGTNAGSPDYRRVYRSLDHGPLRNIFSQDPLKSHPSLRRLGDVIAGLQAARIDADYLPPDPYLFPAQQVQETVDQARQVMDDLETLNPDDRRLLAVCLMFKIR